MQDHAAAKKKERSSQATRARLSVRVAAAARSHDDDGDEANDHDGYEGDERVSMPLHRNTKKPSCRGIEPRSRR